MEQRTKPIGRKKYRRSREGFAVDIGCPCLFEPYVIAKQEEVE
jgi:hypothetical protein